MMDQHDLGWSRYLVLAGALVLVVASIAVAVVLTVLPKRWLQAVGIENNES